MSVNSVSVNCNGYAYSYDKDALLNALLTQNKTSEIDKIEAEIALGNLESLKDLNLTSLVHIAPLPTPRSGMDFLALDSLTGKLVNFSVVEVLMALHEAGKELRQANREMRHAEVDSAKAEALNAADKIRSSAMMNFIFGVVSGAINIAAGLASFRSAVKQGMSLNAPAAQMKSASIEMKQVKADVKLAEAQTRLQTVKGEVTSRQQAQTSAQTKVAESQAKMDRLQGELGELEAASPRDQAAINAKSAEYGNAATEHTANQKSLDAAKADVKTVETRVAELETEVNGLAAKAELANSKQIGSLKKEIDAKKTEIADLRKEQAARPSPETEAKITAAEHDQTLLETKLESRQAQAEMYRNPTSDAALTGAETRLNEGRAQLDGPVGERFALAQKELDQAVANTQLAAAKVQGMTSAMGGLSQIASSTGNYLGSQRQAEGAEHTAEAEKHRAAADESADFQKSWNDTLQSVQSIFKEILQAQNQANAAIYRNM